MSLQLLQQKLPEMKAWIDQTLATHAARARPVATFGFSRLSSYYEASVLAAAKVVVVPRRVPTPNLSEMGLRGFAEFEHMDAAGITYLSTYFVKSDFQRDESLHFHELVHVVQWQQLGPEQFIMAYALGHLLSGGYRSNPLETMAYDLQAAFDRQTLEFDVASLVSHELQRVVPALLQQAARL